MGINSLGELSGVMEGARERARQSALARAKPSNNKSRLSNMQGR